MTRDELNDQARGAGIADPESYPNMEELSAAIAAASGNSGGDEAPAPGAAMPDNDTIAHTDKDAPLTTRSDATDLGVPMRPASDPSAESVGPEDALDPNARGDYSGRIASGPHVVMDPVPADERKDTVVTDDDGNVHTERGPNVQPREVAPGV